LCVLSFSAGVTALTDAISGNGAMTSLNLSDNMLGAEGAKHIAEGITVSKCAVSLHNFHVDLATG
jgi:hypothetical protein